MLNITNISRGFVNYENTLCQEKFNLKMYLSSTSSIAAYWINDPLTNKKEILWPESLSVV